MQYETVHTALKNWHKPASKAGLLADSPLFRLYYPAKTKCRRMATNEILQTGLTALAAENEPAARLLRTRFLDQEKMFSLANKKGFSDKTLQRQQKRAIIRLAELISAQEKNVPNLDSLERLLARLPSVDHQPIGMDNLVTEVSKALVTSTMPRIVTIEGIGGLGKTTLAATAVRRILTTGIYDELVWLTISPEMVAQPSGMLSRMWTQFEGAMSESISEQELLVATRSRLAKNRSLVVLDNLETLQDVETLRPIIDSFTNQAKLLLTSRVSLRNTLDVYPIRLSELSINDTLTLIRREAKQGNIAEVLVADEAELRPIYAAVGGNPLALKLALKQLRLYGLNGALQNLIEARGRSVADLYSTIFGQSWDSLNEASRTTLLALATAAVEGASLPLLAGSSKLPQADLVDALETLTEVNLIDSVGNLRERRFRLHPLTRTFLRQEMARWNK